MGALDSFRSAVADATGLTEYREERAGEVQEQAGGWFPRLDAGAGHATEFLGENPNYSLREQIASDVTPKYSPSIDFDEKSVTFRKNYSGFKSTGTADVSREDYREHVEREDREVDQWVDDQDFGLVSGFLIEDVGVYDARNMRQLATGVDEGGERTTTGINEAVTPAYWAVGPLSRGAGVAARGGGRMAQGALNSARQSMKRASTYMPERLAPIGGAPVRANAPKGVKGATGSVARKVDDVTTSIGKRADAIPFGRTIGSVGSVAAIVGGTGALLGPVDVASGNTGATVADPVDTFHNPFGQIVKLRDNETTLGYVTVVEYHGPSGDPSEATILVDQRGTTRKEAFPPDPNFGSRQDAQTAYTEWVERSVDPGSASQGLMDMGPYGAGDDSWDLPQHTRRLDAGWHLYQQEHNGEERERFIVAAFSRDGGLIYLDSDASADTSFSAFKEHGEAMGAHQRWRRAYERDDLGPEAPTPDVNADRPTPNEVGGTDRVGVLGLSVSNDTLMKAATALAAVLIGAAIYGGLT